MIHPILLSFSLALSTPAFASESLPVSEPTVAQLTEQLAQLEADASASVDEIADLRFLLSNGTALVDIGRPVEERIAAAMALTERAEPSSFAFLYAASRTERPVLRRLIIELAPRWKNDGAARLLKERVVREFGEGAALRRQKAFEGLVALSSDAAADALWELSASAQILRPIRETARALLLEHYVEYLEKRGGLPTEKTDSLATTSTLVGSAVTGGVLLSSVGTWGQSEAGTTVGALGGAAIGAGTAALYLRSNTVSRGAGLRYASNVFWGLGSANLAVSALDLGDRDIEALFRTVGVSTGAITGYGRLQHQPSQANVLETNVGGIIGLHLGSTIPAVVQPEPRSERVYDLIGRERSAAGLAGGAVGLGVATLVQDDWSPDVEDGLFSSLMGIEGAIVMGTLPNRHGLHRRNADAYGNLGFSLGLTGGLVLTHYVDIPAETSLVAATGSVIGHIAGDGVAKLDKQKYENTSIGSQIAVPAGLVGTVAGAVTAPWLDPSLSDAAAIGVSTLLTTSQAAALGYYLQEKKVLVGYQQEAITQLTGASTALIMLIRSPKIEVAPTRSLFLLTGAGWGAWYGALGEMVVPNKLTEAETAIVVAGSMDVGLATVAILGSEKVGIEPEDTFVPQLFGVAGGTVGALAVMLGTESSRKIAGGALVGSTLGLGAGALMAPKMRKSAQNQRLHPHPLAQAPKASGHWSFVALPRLDEAGQWGGQFQLQGVGL